MEYRTLENTDSVCIYEAFTQAFSDYQVSVDMSFKSFEIMLKRNGFMPAVSVGAFADRTLVGFILNGVRDWDNEKTVYDLGTGVIPDFRRTGIMGELLNLVSTICINGQQSKIFGLIHLHGKTQKTLFVQSLNPFLIRLLNLMET